MTESSLAGSQDDVRKSNRGFDGGAVCAIHEALLHSPIPALRKLQVEQTEAGVIISGSVPSYYLKQLAQETVLPYLDHCALVNRVTVIANGKSEW
jgi:hypothetical protein